MKNALFLRIALKNIRVNSRFYVPYILTGTGLQACFYIVLTLAADQRMSQVPGGSMIPIFMAVGAAVMALLSCILLFYANSFLMRQRKKEFGLYAVLGMEKRHTGRVIIAEALFSGGISVLSGLILGILFYKLCTLFICRLLKTEVITGFYYISPLTTLPAGAFFALIFLFTCVYDRISVAHTKPTELLNAVHTGEKEPRSRWIVLGTGILSLGAGYTLSLTTNTLSAIYLFFAAVFLVILGTYCLFTAGSVFVLKALKNRKSFYYEKRHMTTVSGLLFRMKQNAAGLASVAILATGVIIMISTTFSLYSGMQETLEKNYPEEMYLQISCTVPGKGEIPFPEEELDKLVRACAEKSGNRVIQTHTNRFLDVSFVLHNGRLYSYSESGGIREEPSRFCFRTAEECGVVQEMQDNEILIKRLSSALGDMRMPEGTLTIFGKEYRIIGTASAREEELISGPVSSFLIAVKDEDELKRIYDAQKKAYGPNASDYSRLFCVKFENREQLAESGEQISKEVERSIREWVKEREGPESEIRFDQFDTLWESRGNMLGLYGTFLFLGFILGVVCLFATVLIIYYKQICEGYEDRQRYQIMKKIGMSETEVRSSIRSETLLMFFLPLAVAGIHVCFAFPILNRMLLLLMLPRTGIFVLCSVIAFLVFAGVYALIYRFTARTYYRIVN